MKSLKELGLIKSKCKSSMIFEEISGDTCFLDLEDMSPSGYVQYYWEKYKKTDYFHTSKGDVNNALNGKVFELIIHTMLYKNGILPFYVQANVAFVPNIEYDTILYSEKRPICLSLKTSLRERYKQADLESIALKYVHRKAECYLLSLDQNEVSSVNDKIDRGFVIGLNKAYYCLSEDFNQFICNLKNEKESFVESGSVQIIDGWVIK